MGDDELTFTVVNDMGGVDLDGSLTIPSSEAGQLVTAAEVTEAEGDEAMLQHHVGEFVGTGMVSAVAADEIGLDSGQQILTIDGKHLFVVTSDGNFAAVTADCLESGVLALNAGEEEAGQPQEEDEAGPPLKRIKVEETEDGGQQQRLEKITLENGIVLDIYNNGTGEITASDDGIVLVGDDKNPGGPSSSSASSGVASRSVGGRTPLDEDADPTQAWFTTRDDKQTLTTRGHRWKQGQWSKDEVDVLQRNISQYCVEHSINDPTEVIFEMSKDERKDFYRTVARGLNRPLFSVYRRVIRMYDQKNHIGKYRQEEIARLRELRTIHGNDWAKIGAALGRSASSVKDKCRLMREMCNAGKWLPAEEKRLAEAVYTLSGTQPGENVTSGLSWALVAEQVVTRSEKQCRTKWLNYLNWKQQGGSEWTRLDDIKLMDRIAEMGVEEETGIDWNKLTENWSSVRSPQWLRGKWWTLKRHIPDYQILPFQQLVSQAREFHTQNLRASLPGGSTTTTKPRPPKQPPQQPPQQQQLLDPATQYVVSMPDNTSLLVGGGEDDGSSQGGGGLISYEVLPPGFSGHAFLIAQPQPQGDGSEGVKDEGGEHIILHTLPMAHNTPDAEHVMQGDLADMGSSSAPATGQHYVIEEALDPQSKDPLHHIQLTHPAQISLEGSGESMDKVGEEVIGLAGHNHSHTYVMSTSEEEHGNGSEMSDLHSSTFSRTSRSDVDLLHMSSLSDPMLPPSETTDLMTEIDPVKSEHS